MKQIWPFSSSKAHFLTIAILSIHLFQFYSFHHHSEDRLATWFLCWNLGQYFRIQELRNLVLYSDVRWFLEFRYSLQCFLQSLNYLLLKFLVFQGKLHPNHEQDSYFYQYIKYFHNLLTIQDLSDLLHQRKHGLLMNSWCKLYCGGDENQWYHLQLGVT